MKVRSKSRAVRCRPCGVLCSGIFGAVLFGFVAFAVTALIYESAHNEAFAIPVGAVLVALGSVIIVRACVNRRPGEKCGSAFVIGFACLVILAGVLAAVLDVKPFKDFPAFYRYTTFCLMGLGLTFGFTFALVDILNHFVLCTFRSSSYYQSPRLVVSTRSQIVSVLFLAVSLGLFYGLEYGVLSTSALAGKNASKDKDKDLWTHVMSTVPIGALAGLVCGVLNEWILRPVPANVAD